MFTILVALAAIICVFLVIVVLIQNPKGGGVSQGFSAANQVIGVQRTGDFLEKATWGLAISLMVICLSFSVIKPSNEESGNNTNSDTQGLIDNANSAPTAAPTPAPAPTATPAAAPATTPAK